MFLIEIVTFFVFFICVPFVYASQLFKNNQVVKYITPLSLYLITCLYNIAINCFVLSIYLIIMPGHKYQIYLFLLLISNLLLSVLVFANGDGFQVYRRAVFQNILHHWQFKIPIIIMSLTIVIIIILIRPFCSDALDYFEISKIFFNTSSLPYQGKIINQINGFSAHVFHPPFYTVMHYIGYLVQGTVHYSRVQSYFVGYFGLMFILMMLNLMRENYLLGFVLILEGMLISNHARDVFLLPNGLDTFRFCYFLLPFVFLKDGLVFKSKIFLYLFALSLACCLAVHSSGIVVTVLMIGIYLASAVDHSDEHYKKYQNALKIVLLAIAIGGWQYIVNLIYTGKIVSDSTAVWQALNYEYYMQYERNIHTLYQKLIALSNQFFSLNRTTYGYVFFIAFLVVIYQYRYYCLELKQGFYNFISYHQKKLQPLSEHFLFVVGFYSVVILSIALNQSLIVKNFRYLYTAYPSILILIYGFVNRKCRWCHSAPFKVGLFFVSIILFCSLLNYIKQGYSNYSFTPAMFYKQSKDTISNQKLLPGIQEVSEYLLQNQKKSEKVIIFEGNQLYQLLPANKLINYLDDGLISLYRSKSVEELYFALKQKQIKYIVKTYYFPSALLSTPFSDLISNPQYTSLKTHFGGYLLYEINNKFDNKWQFINNDQKKFINLQPQQHKLLVYKINPNTNYKVTVFPQTNVVYQLNAHAFNYPVAFLTYDKSASFGFFITDKDKQDSQLTIEVTAMDKPIALSIELVENRRFVKDKNANSRG